MTVRVKERHEHSLVALVVITFLGSIAIIGTGSSAFLIHEALIYEGSIDAAVVALIGQMVSIATLSIGALGAMLSSTSPKPAAPPSVPASSGQPESVPVTIVNPPADPVPTDPQSPIEPDPAPEPDVPAGVGDDGPGDEEPEPAPASRARSRSPRQR